MSLRPRRLDFQVVAWSSEDADREAVNLNSLDSNSPGWQSAKYFFVIFNLE